MVFEDNMKLNFNLFFAGNTYKDINEDMVRMGCPKLYTQIYERKYIDALAKLKKEGKTISKLLVDSGAFSAHRSDITIDIDDYCNYINSLGDGVDMAVELDLIPGKFGQAKTFEQVKEGAKVSWENYLYMRDRLNNPDVLLPVFHQDEDFSNLKRMLNFKDPSGNQIKYICISGSKDYSAKYRGDWYYRVFSLIHNSSNPDIKTHCLGNSSISQLEQFPFYSSDATTWIKHAAYGSIITEKGMFCVSSQSKENQLIDKNYRDYLLELIHDYGFTEEQISNSAKYRQWFNVRFYMKWAQNYEYKGPKKFTQRNLFF